MSSVPESTLAALLEASTESLLALDSEGRVSHANTSAYELLGSGAPVVGERFVDLVPPVARRSVRALLQARDGGVETVIARRRVELQVHEHGDGAVVRIAALPTPRRAFARDSGLREFLLRFPYGIVTVRESGSVGFANPLAKMLFRPLELRTGRPLPEPWPLSLSLASLIARARRSHAPALATVETDAQTLRVAVVAPLATGDAVLVVEDVTRQHESVRAYGEFVRNAAHQMRTPATAIATAVEILQGGAKHDPAQRDRFLAHVERETGRLIRLIKALLVLARAQAGVQAPRLEFVPLRPLLEDVVRPFADAAGPDVHVTCHPSLAVFVERDLLEQAFQALLDNAVRHGRARVTVRAWESGSGRVTVEVDDDGEGILPELLGRVQEPFYRASADTAGFGLGLAIATQAVAALGGSLRIASASRGGTQATMELRSARIREAM